MQERRLRKRRYLMFYSRVFDRVTGKLVGHLVDITPEGAMLISEEPVEPHTLFQLQMELPEYLSSQQHLRFEAKSLWCKRDIVPSFFDIGLQLLNVGPQEVDIIEHLVEEYGFRDT